jgi:4-hydroxyphenylacetate 3-monooxygenase
VGEIWSLYDASDVLAEMDPQFAGTSSTYRPGAASDPFHVSANTDPKGDRSKAAARSGPGHAVACRARDGCGIVVRGAKFETAAAYANQAFTKPTIANWGDAALSDYAVGFICDQGAPGLKFICRLGICRACRGRRTIRFPTGSTRSTRWWSSTMC